MLDLSSETLVSLAEGAQLVPPSRGGRPVAPSTLWRWIHEGFRLRSGAVVKLEGAKVLGRWATTQQALQRFLAKLAGDGMGDGQKARKAGVVAG